MSRKFPNKRSDNIDRGKNINRLITCSPTMDILIRDLESFETHDEIIDIRHIMNRKRVNTKGLFVTEAQWPYFYKAMTEINERKNRRSE